MKQVKNISLLAIIALVMIMTGCDKTKPYTIDVAPAQAHFVGGKTQVYSVVDDPAPSFVLQVGSTDVATVDRLVTYNISSPSGAVLGTQYTVNSGTAGNTVTIPANGALASITVQANYSAYSSGRKDTLIFTLAQPSMTPATFLDTVRLIIAGPSGCNEANVNLTEVLGVYDNTNELFAGSPYGPYTTTISGFTQLTPTSASIVVTNIWDNGWGPITFILDWSDPLNRTATVVQQDAIPGSNAGDLNAAYAGQTVAVRAPSATLSPTPGTYSYCDQTFTLQMQLGVTNLGYFNALYTVNMVR